MPISNKKNSKNSKDSWDPDEIPGYTTFLVGQNRFRESWEYANSETHVVDNLQFDLNKENILIEKNELEDSVNVTLAQIEVLRKRNLKLGEAIKAQDSTIEELEFLHSSAREELKHANDNIDELTLTRGMVTSLYAISNKNLLCYGDHNNDCNYYELLMSGRVSNMSEKDVCDCGWSAASEKLSSNIKK